VSLSNNHVQNPELQKAYYTGILKNWHSNDTEAAEAWMADNTIPAGVKNNVLNQGN